MKGLFLNLYILSACVASAFSLIHVSACTPSILSTYLDTYLYNSSEEESIQENIHTRKERHHLIIEDTELTGRHEILILVKSPKKRYAQCTITT
jgi:hypothetical protein